MIRKKHKKNEGSNWSRINRTENPSQGISYSPNGTSEIAPSLLGNNDRDVFKGYMTFFEMKQLQQRYRTIERSEADMRQRMVDVRRKMEKGNEDRRSEFHDRKDSMALWS